MAKKTTCTRGSVRLRNGVWNYRITVNGKQIERVGTKDKEETEKMMIQAIAESDRNGILFKASNISVDEMVDMWYEEYCYKAVKHGTRRDYSNVIKNHIKPYMGKVKLKDINVDFLQKYIDEKSAKYAKSTYLDAKTANNKSMELKANNFTAVALHLLLGGLVRAISPYPNAATTGSILYVIWVFCKI